MPYSSNDVRLIPIALHVPLQDIDFSSIGSNSQNVLFQLARCEELQIVALKTLTAVTSLLQDTDNFIVACPLGELCEDLPTACIISPMDETCP